MGHERHADRTPPLNHVMTAPPQCDMLISGHVCIEQGHRFPTKEMEEARLIIFMVTAVGVGS